jgi:Calcineurin-like phosphoesterase
MKLDPKTYKRILVISDMHHPYAHQDTVPFLRALKDRYKFDKVVCIGDEIDYHALSFHDSDPDLASAGYELEMAIQELRPIYKMFPKVNIVESNHGSMVLRKALANGMPRRVLKNYNEILCAPKGWKWSFDLKLKTPLGLVYFAHGKSAAPGRLASQYGMSAVQGHFHEKAQINYISTPEKLMFDLHTGCLADDNSLALGYNKVNVKRPIVSVAVIIDGIPQIVPMVLNSKGRWIGKL